MAGVFEQAKRDGGECLALLTATAALVLSLVTSLIQRRKGCVSVCAVAVHGLCKPWCCYPMALVVSGHV